MLQAHSPLSKVPSAGFASGFRFFVCLFVCFKGWNLFIYLFILLQDICFTTLCWLLPYTNMNRPWAYMCSLPLKPPPTSRPAPPPGCHRALGQLPESHGPSATHDNVHVSMLLSPSVPPSPSHTASRSALSVSITALQMRPHLPQVRMAII